MVSSLIFTVTSAVASWYGSINCVWSLDLAAFSSTGNTLIFVIFFVSLAAAAGFTCLFPLSDP
jgi:hypothetical protein